jgi:hypothetical protein
MIASRTRGGGRITVDQRADGSGEALQAIIGDVGDLSVQAAVGDFDLATLLTQVPAPLTALNLDACRMRFHRQLAASLLELEATAVGVKAAAFAYRQAEKGISEAFGGLLDAIGYATGRIIAISLPVIIPVAITIGVQVLVVSKILDVTGLDDVITTHFGIDLGKTKAQAKEALVTAVFEHSDVAGAVIEHVLPGIVVGFVGLPPALLDTDADHAYWPHDSQSMTVWLLAGANQFGLLLPSDVEVWEAEGVTPPHEKPPRDLEDLYLREAACHRGTDSGQVRIEEIVGPDGTTRYIIYVPATTDWSAKSGDNTTDMTTNVQGMAGNDTVMREMVRQAIADAGIDPNDEVMLVGYSQGGITAGSLAADPAFLADVNVTALMTVGSPISDFAIGSGHRRALHRTRTGPRARPRRQREPRRRQLVDDHRRLRPRRTAQGSRAQGQVRCRDRRHVRLGRCRALIDGLCGIDRPAAALGEREPRPVHREEFGILHRRSQEDPGLPGQTQAHVTLAGD